MTVEYLVSTSSTQRLSDYLNSTSLTADANGAKVLELRYKACSLRYTSGVLREGEVRATWTANPSTTPAYKFPAYTYTGQYSYMDDPATSGVTEGFGLMFYQSRWFDPSLGRFTQADTITSGGAQGYDRYAYVSNNPIKLSDPSGHKCVGDAAECLNDDGSKGSGFTGGDTKPNPNLGCGVSNQPDCGGKKAKNNDTELTTVDKIGIGITAIMVDGIVVLFEGGLFISQLALLELGPLGVVIDLVILPFEFALGDFGVSFQLMVVEEVDTGRTVDFKWTFIPSLFSDLPTGVQKSILSDIPAPLYKILTNKEP
jgi:RHS repeat-associated protein